jgi:uncharacterized membrane protein AbrB (regulator of aidB expression)
MLKNKKISILLLLFAIILSILFSIYSTYSLNHIANVTEKYTSMKSAAPAAASAI